MLICIVSRGVPSVKDPQWGCFEKDQANALKSLGHKVVVVSVDTRFRLFYRKFGVKRTNLDGIDYFDCFVLPSVITRILLGSEKNIYIRYLQLEYIYKKVQKLYGTPDIIYAHYLPNIYIASKLKEKYNIPVVGIEHWSKLNVDKLSADVFFMGKYAYFNIDALISVSENLRIRIYQHFHKDSIVIHNMVGSEFWQKCLHHNSGREKNTKNIKFISVGSLLYDKGYDLLIEAFAISGIKDFELNIIGEGNYRRNLEALIRQKGLSNKVFLVGKKCKQDIIRYLLESDIFVHPSRGENFSVAIIEGLSAGLPVIASLCGGASECINKSNGLIFPVGDVKELSDKLLYMSLNYRDYDKQKISDDCRNNYSPEIIASKIVAVFNNVLDKYKS